MSGLPESMHERLEIAAVIPTYNRAGTLPRAVASVALQTRPPDELVVVDDGSTDDSEAAVAALNLPGVRYVRQENAGANRARNRGVEETTAPWIAFQDSDDAWFPLKLARMEEAVQAARAAGHDVGQEIGVVFSSFISVDPAAGKSEIKPVPPEGVPAPLPLASGAAHLIKDPLGTTRLLVENLISTQTLMVRRDVFEAAGGFDESLKRFQDWDLAIRLAAHSPFLWLPEPLVFAEMGSGSLSRSMANGIAARERFLEKYAEAYAARPDLAREARRAIQTRRLALKGRSLLGRS